MRYIDLGSGEELAATDPRTMASREERIAAAQRKQAAFENATVLKRLLCATCGRRAKIRRFGKAFCNPHCAAQYEEPVEAEGRP